MWTGTEINLLILFSYKDKKEKKEGELDISEFSGTHKCSCLCVYVSVCVGGSAVEGGREEEHAGKWIWFPLSLY